MSLSLCTPVLYGILLLIVHTLCLTHFVVQVDFTYTHLGANTVLGWVLLLYIYTLVQSLLTLGLYIQLHCTTVHLVV